MTDWLFEGRLPVYVALASAAAFFVFLWSQSRRRAFLFAAGACLALVAVYFLLDRFVETDREQIEGTIRDMAGAIHDRDLNRLFSHVSEDFKRGSTNKAALRTATERILNERLVTEVHLGGFEWTDDSRSREPPDAPRYNRARVYFTARPEGEASSGVPYPCEVRMKRDADGRWRMIDFEVYRPPNTNEPLAIPHLGR